MPEIFDKYRDRLHLLYAAFVQHHHLKAQDLQGVLTRTLGSTFSSPLTEHQSRFRRPPGMPAFMPLRRPGELTFQEWDERQKQQQFSSSSSRVKEMTKAKTDEKDLQAEYKQTIKDAAQTPEDEIDWGGDAEVPPELKMQLRPSKRIGR